MHRTLRPEAYGGLAHHRLANGVTDYPLHDDFLRSEALGRTRAKHGTYLLSQTYPDGSPIFSAYPGGGAAVAGVDGDPAEGLLRRGPGHRRPGAARSARPDAAGALQRAAADGRRGAEQDGANFAMGRNWTGIHWWSDAAASMAIGEEVAIGMLRDERATYREDFEGFSFTRFDGSRVTV